MEFYPSWRYHATEEASIVHNEEQDTALGAGWRDSPAHFLEDDFTATDEEVDPDSFSGPGVEPAPKIKTRKR